MPRFPVSRNRTTRGVCLGAHTAENASACFIEHSAHETLLKQTALDRHNADAVDIYGRNSESDCTIEHARRFLAFTSIEHTRVLQVIGTCFN